MGSIFIGRWILHPPAYEDGTDKEFRNLGYQEPDAGESPKKEQFTVTLLSLISNGFIPRFIATIPLKFSLQSPTALSYQLSTG